MEFSRKNITIGIIAVAIALIATIMFYNIADTSQLPFSAFSISEEPSKTFYNETDGTIIITNDSHDLAIYDLIENTDQCLTDCRAIIETELLVEGVLSEGIEFRNKVGDTKEINEFKYFTLQADNYDIEVPVYEEVCDIVNISIEVCWDNQTGTTTEEVTTYDWKRYTGTILPAGTYRWKIEGRKDHSESVDWIITSFGEELTQWAWWNSTWSKKREIQIREETGIEQTNYPIRLNVTFDSDMNATWVDLRFLNNTEDSELDFFLWNTTSSYALIDVELNLSGGSNTTIYMYYDNDNIVESTSNGTNTFTVFFGDFEDDTVGDLPTGWYDYQGQGVGRTNNTAGFAYEKAQYFTASDISGANPIGFGDDLSQTYTQGSWRTWYRKTSGVNEQRFYLWSDAVRNVNRCFVTDFGTKTTNTEAMFQFNSSDKYRVLDDGDILKGFTAFDGAFDCGSFMLDATSGDTATYNYDVISFGNWTFPEPSSTIGAEQEDLPTTSVDTELLSPVNNSNSTQPWAVVSWNSSAIASNLTNTTLFFWNSSDALVNTTFLLINGTQNISTVNVTPLLESMYIWNAKSRNDVGNETFGDNRSLDVHLTPVDMQVIYPTGQFSSIPNGTNLSVNWTLSENVLNLSEHIVNCSFVYNGVRSEVTVTDCTTINSSSFIYITDINNISVNVTEEFGFQTINTSTWTVVLTENDSNFSEFTVEGSTESFFIEVVATPSLSITIANLIYNSTSFIGAFSEIESNVFNANVSLSAPNVGEDQNISFFWNFILNDSTQVNSTEKQQRVSNLTIDDCSVFGANTVVYNFTMKDEESQVKLNGSFENSTIEIDLDLFTLDRSSTVLEFSKNFSKINPVSICLSVNLTDDTQYSLDTQVRYEATQYAPEFYNIQNFTLKNSTANQSINLFDLLLADSTEFLITFKDVTFLPVEDALIQITRKYVGEGVFKTVEIPKTDSDGQAVAHLDLKTVLYTLVVTKFGQVLATFDNVAVICQDVVVGDCKINLNALATSETFPDWESVGGASVAQSFNENTRTITSNVVTSDGTARTFLLNATLFDRFGNETVCSQSLTTASGTLTCTIPVSFGNATVISRMSLDGSVVRTDTYSISQNPEEIFGGGVFILAFILILTFPLMMIGSYIGVLIGGILGLIIASLLLFMNIGGTIGSSSAVIWFIIAIGIVIWKISQSRDGI